jgi:YD repeat-containing protein
MKSAVLLNLLRHRFFLFIVTPLLALGLWVMNAGAQGGISYVYDELGRLIAVTDPAGDTAIYSYDAVGNITSISRYSSSTLSLIKFTPASGPVGTTVTIYGTAFSTTPSQNTVTFNGTAATVVSATATKIVTTVPTGATTGVISVATTGSPVSSAASFTVTAGSGAPTITSFSPTIGPPGTSVTITGTNFQTIAVANKTKFNTTIANVSSATATSISTSVPTLSGSGKIAVSTPDGAVLSANDFFIPPAPYAAADVIATGRMTSGGSQSVTFSTANKIAMFVFEATAGQRASVKVTSSTISTTKISLLTPNGLVAGWANAGTGSTGFADSSLFPTSGTHAVVIDPNGSSTGSMTFTLYVLNDVTGTITPGGSSITVTTTIPGQNVRYIFPGTANQRVSLKINSVSFSGGTNFSMASIRKPDGTILKDQNYYTNAFMDTTVLPSNGTYTVMLDHGTSTIGSVTITLYDVPPDTHAGSASLSAGGFGVPHTATFTIPGQNSYITVEGLLGQRISFNLGTAIFNGGTSFYYIRVQKPDGTILVSQNFSGTGFLDIITLPVDGTYLVLIDPADSSWGSLNVTVHDVPEDTTGTITVGGSAVTVTNSHPGQNGKLTFSGTANQRVSIRMTSVAFTNGTFAWVYLKKPDGSTLASVFFAEPSGFLDTQVLPSTGTYTILVDPSDGGVGNTTVTAYEVPADVTGSVTVGGSALNVANTTPGQNADITFEGTASQQVTVSVANSTMSCIAVTLKQPNGSTLTTKSSCGTSFSLTTQTLPTTGTYTIKIDPSGANTGNLNVNVTNP